MRNARNIFFFEKSRPAALLPCPASYFPARKGAGNAARIVLLYLLLFFVAAIPPGAHVLLAPASATVLAAQPHDENVSRLARPPAAQPSSQGALQQWHLESMLLCGLTGKRIPLVASLSGEFQWAAYGHASAALQRNRLNPARLLAYNFLRVSDGEWIPLCRPFSGEQLYAGAVRSFLPLHGNQERTSALPA
ncbi:exported hypothetical protein [uncultured delta proteobacterium]|uniref:Uncharacterized protein n=1 Tax=uncultured delta proteobacterium TaxID=34034 RepID=A0A212JL31_9DELT|nr:exported hypothetical protein [uncultured delta proteobacterium]